MFRHQMPRYVRKMWQPYETRKVPKTAGIYAIRKARGRIQYIGQSSNLRERLNRHKYGTQQDISKFVRKEFAKNHGKTLRIKWIATKEHKCIEGRVLDYVAKKIGYWPSKNKKRGNKC